MLANIVVHLSHSLSRSISLFLSRPFSFSAEILDISKNYIKSLPDLSEMRSLRLLSAFNNRITCMPTLPSRGQLDRIHFGENLLTDLDMASLKASAGTLTELLLQGNQLSICPESIHSLHSLKILDLSNNCLTNLPHALGYMTSLYKILVEGNPIRTVRRTLLSTPAAEELKVYLRTRGPPPLELSVSQIRQ